VTDLLILGDIAGQYDALMRLLKKCPDYLPVSIGDMIDRGPDSKKVLEFFMKNGKALLGNHEHMLLDFAVSEYYDFDIWLQHNGGKETLYNFVPSMCGLSYKEMKAYIPFEIIEWITNLPLYMEIDGGIITHAPIHPDHTLEECCEFVSRSFKYYFIPGVSPCDRSVIWNRKAPRPIPDKYQIFGHNGYHYFLTDGDDDDSTLEYNEYGVCIDGSRQNTLMAMVWPSKEVIMVDILPD
jgi:hypothetical protein